MSKPMRTLGVGSRCSILMLAIATLGGTSAACSTREAGARSDGAASSSERAGEPEQVVQTIRTQAVQTQGASSDQRDALGEARASAAGVSRANGASLPPRSNGAETITTKHLEAELNRLEAELAN